MAILVNDTFTRTSASTWGTSNNGLVWVPQGTGAVFSTAATYGNITGSVNVVTHAELPVAHTDIEIVGRFLFSVMDAQSWAGFCVRFTDTNNYYHSRISGAGNLSISKKVTGTGTDLVTYAFTPVIATWYWIRFRVIGSTLQSKYWIDGSPEPPGWRLQTTDAALASGTFITCRHNMATGASYTRWDDIYAVNYTPAFFNTEVLQDTPGILTKTLIPSPDSYSVADSASTTSETVNTAVAVVSDVYSRVNEDTTADMALIVLADGYSTQSTAAITESIGTNYESVDANGVIASEKFFTIVDAITSTSTTSNAVAITDMSTVTDTTGRSAEEREIGAGEALVNSLFMVSGTASAMQGETLVIIKTQEKDISKNLFEMITDSLALSKEQKIIEAIPTGVLITREQDITYSDVLTLLADGLVALNGVFESIVYNLETLDAAGGISGDNKDTTLGHMLIDTLARQGAYQLQESLVVDSISTQEKNFFTVLTTLLSDIYGQSSDRNVTLYNNIVDVLLLLAERKDNTALFLQDVFSLVNFKTVTSSDVLQDIFSLLSETTLQEQLFVDASGATTQEILTTALLQLLDTIGYRQETHYKDIVALVSAIEHLLGQETVSQSEVLVDDAGHVVTDYPVSMKKLVHWEIPRGTIQWKTPLMIVRWHLPNNVAYWILEE